MMTTLGSRLREARLAAGLTQFQLARGIVTTSQLSLIEHDRRRPSPGTLTAFARRLQLPPVELAFGVMSGSHDCEPRLGLARQAVEQRDYAKAEQLATHVIQQHVQAEQRVSAFLVRAAAREGQLRLRPALDDLLRAHMLAKQINDPAGSARIAVACARLRSQLQADDAA